jgi:hypothetical protein
LPLDGEGITWMGQASWEGIGLFSVRIEFWQRVLDHIVALNERHLRRLLSEYVRYHHEDRTYLGLEDVISL